MKGFMLSALLCMSVISSGWANAADFPTHPIRLIVPFTPGTGMDRIARKVAEQLHSRWGQPVVVENPTGAAGHIGAQMVASSPADGHTLLVTASNLSITSILFKSATFDATTALTPVGISAWGNSTLVATPKAKFNTLGELIALAKTEPGQLTFATPGTGSPQHIAMALFQEAAGVSFLHVPYKGTAPAITDLIAGHVDLMFVATHTVMPYVKAGQVKTIAVVSDHRSAFAPTIPSFGELGITGVSTEAWYGFLAPAGTPPDIVKKLNTEITSILEMPDIKKDLQTFGLNVQPSTPEEMAKVMQKEHDQYAAIIKKNHIVVE